MSARNTQIKRPDMPLWAARNPMLTMSQKLVDIFEELKMNYLQASALHNLPRRVKDKP